MTHLKFIVIFLIVGLSANGQSPDETPQKNSFTTSQDHLSYIIFGIFCGECSGHCATMYRYNIIGNTNTLLVDSTDSYFTNGGKVVCNTQIYDKAKFQVVYKLVQSIPKSFFKSGRIKQTFGCPDCTDGCGIYFEMRQDMKTKKFYIDYQTAKLYKEVRNFGEFIEETLNYLNKKN